MKVLWIVLGVFAVVLLLCCGSGIFFGNQLVRGVQTVNNEADMFARKVTKEVTSDWNPETLMKYASPEFEEVVNDEKLAKLFKFLSSKLGPSTSIGEFTASTTSAQTRNGDSFTLITTSGDAAFAKGSGKVEMKVVKRRGQWSVVHFRVNSDVLLEATGLEPGSQSSERF